MSIALGRYYVFGKPTGYGFLYRNGTLDLYWPHPYNYEHPPLAKILIGVSIFIFGDTLSGARLLGALMGVATVLLLFFIARRLLGCFYMGFLSAFLLAIETLHIGLSRVAMLDIYMLFFEMAGFASLLLLGDRFKISYPLSGLMFGAAIASKWLGAYGFLAAASYIFYDIMHSKRQSRRGRVFFASIGLLLAFSVYIASYIPYMIMDYSSNPSAGKLAEYPYLDLSKHDFRDFIDLQFWMLRFMWYWHQTGTQYGYLFMSPLSYVIPDNPGAPVLWMNAALFYSSVAIAVFSLLFNLRLRSNRREMIALAWYVPAVIPLIQKGFVWYLISGVPPMCLLATIAFQSLLNVRASNKSHRSGWERTCRILAFLLVTSIVAVSLYNLLSYGIIR
jgi:4-amino-4-deoxy-L-arabinose transferase-like glycosyltransferase